VVRQTKAVQIGTPLAKWCEIGREAMRKGNIKGLIADAAKVAEKLRETETSFGALLKKYHVHHTVLKRVILSQIEWQQISQRLREGRTYKVMKAAPRIARRLRKTDVTLRKLMKQYRCGYGTMMKAIRSQMSDEEWSEIRRKNLARGGVKNRFKKGHIPWTKGRKGLHFSPATEFKPGHMRGQAARLWRPVGTITIHHDKLPKRQRYRKRRRMDGSLRMGKPRRWIKVADEGRPQDRWIPYARYLWEKEHGPVPKGRFVVHTDGNQMLDKPGNLMLANCRENLIRNQLLNPEMRKRAHALACKNRKKNTRQRKQLEAFYGPQIVVWECGGCGAEYQQQEQPQKCVKCNGFAFEKLKRRQIKKVG